ncbi:MAG: hypothetical protein M1822_003395 [Bathelium mastoideum]|nr:MAG: hypothetical protein M1822_003395 [Bathelium mastoideum]
MSATFNNVFILGATSGLGADLARRYYQAGKTVMIAGRRQERLQAMQKEMPGLETIQIDAADIKSLPENLKKVTTRFPDMDQIILMSGSGSHFDYKNSSTSTDEAIASEVTLNVTFPMVAARLLVPHFLARNKPAQIVLIGSGLAYVPMSLYPTYSATKSAIHSFACTLRGQLAGTPIIVTELAPPYVDTDFDKNFRTQVNEVMGDHALVPMPLKEFTDQAYAGLEDRSEGKPKNEVAIGFAAMGSAAWWGAFGPIFDNLGISAQKA